METKHKAKLLNELAQFTGTENYYFHPLYKKFNYTDGVRFLAKNAGAYWLIEQIFLAQYSNINLPEQEFQAWELIVHQDKTADLTCHDGNYNYQHQEKLAYTDFPLDKISLYFINNTLILTSEY